MRKRDWYKIASLLALSVALLFIFGPDFGVIFAAQIILMAITFSVTDLSLAQLGGDRFTIDLRLLLIILIVVAP